MQRRASSEIRPWHTSMAGVSRVSPVSCKTATKHDPMCAAVSCWQASQIACCRLRMTSMPSSVYTVAPRLASESPQQGSKRLHNQAELALQSMAGSGAAASLIGPEVCSSRVLGNLGNMGNMGNRKPVLQGDVCAARLQPWPS